MGGFLILFVVQLRRGQIPWRPAAKLGAALVAVMALWELNRLSTIERKYETSISLATFHLNLATGFLVAPLVVGLLGWLVMGLATSLYPDAWRIFRSSARRVWRRDAAAALVLSLAAAGALTRLAALVVSRFHAYAPVTVELFPDLINSYSPAAGFLLQSLIWSVFYAAGIAITIYLVRVGMVRRAWWVWFVGLLLLVSLGPAQAHSVTEYALGWGMSFAALVIGVVIVLLFFRDNLLAYVAAAVCLPLGEHLLLLLSQPAAFYRWNGLLLALLTAIILAWMFWGGKEQGPVISQ